MSRDSHDGQDQSTVGYEDAPLTPQGAFVVQFRTTTGQSPGCFAGRAEHMMSGQAMRFHSLEGLVAFMERVLTEVEEGKPT